MKRLADIMADRTASGVYLLEATAQVEEVEKLALARGFASFVLDGRGIQNKEGFLRHIAAALHFPDYFGHNWDALADCLQDMSWHEADGYVIVFDHCEAFADAAPEEFEAVVDIFRGAADFWQEQRKTMLAFLRGPQQKTRERLTLAGG